MADWALERASIIYSSYKAGVLESLNAAIVQSLHEAEERGAKRGRAEGMRGAAEIADKHPALTPCPWCSTIASAIREAASGEDSNGN